MTQTPNNATNRINIAGVKASDRLPVKASALSRYSSKGPQLQQLLVLAWLAGIFLTPFISNVAIAGVLKPQHSYADPEDFYDFEYAKRIWDELVTLDALESEESKYDGGFDEWLSVFMKDKAKAMRSLSNLDDSLEFRRRYDIQLAYDEWRDKVYFFWWNDYKSGSHHRVSFDEWLTKLGSSGRPCKSKKVLTSCGPRPDWRSDKDKADERAMMAEADRLHGRH